MSHPLPGCYNVLSPELQLQRLIQCKVTRRLTRVKLSSLSLNMVDLKILEDFSF